MYNEEILAEYNEVLRRPKFKFPEEHIVLALDAVLEAGIDSIRVETKDEVLDPKDVVFYEVAMSRDDSYLVTGNIKHFPAVRRVVTPNELLGSMALTMMYDLFEFHAKLHSNDQYTDRNTDIVKRLMLLLSTGTTKTHREVGYYADQLGVSMKYLSETVKRQTGNTVMDFIVQYTKPIIIEYLNNPRLSVAQIANALNFTTSNYFTRYCIKHLGMSPREYRTAHQPKN